MPDVAHETELLKEFKLYLLRHANAFHKKACLPAHMLEDVYQEACLAFLLYLRENPEAEDDLRHGRFIIPTSRIRFHLYRQFVDVGGIGLNIHCLRSYLRNHRIPTPMDGDRIFDVLGQHEHVGGCEAFWMDDADTLKAVYLREWIQSMNPQDRKIAILFLSGYNGREIAERMDISQAVVNTHWRNCRKTYVDYVDVA